MLKKYFYILIFSFSLIKPGFSIVEPDSIIQNDRRIIWNPGIPDGIPEITNPLKNVLDYGADPTGKNDSYSAFIKAINAVPSSGGVVLIPRGDYLLGSKITISRDNIVFRGMGQKSKLFSESGTECFEIVTYQRGTYQKLNVGAKKDSSSVIVENGSLFMPGQFAEIDQDNDAELMYTNPDWNVSWAENSVGQLFEVDSVRGNEVFFKAPINIEFTTTLNAQIRPMGLVKNVGFEDLYIEKMKANSHTFMFKNAAYCWMKNVESYHTRRSHVHMTVCLANEIRDSYFHHSFSYGGGGAGYGVECGMHVTNSLVENNIFDYLRHALLIQVGANGNVYGYNYSMRPVQGEDETNLNVGWNPPDISIHGHYPYMNLFEGNEANELGIGDFWGPSGPGNTYFRNKIKGEGIYYYDASHSQNLVGNITTKIINSSSSSSAQKLEHGNVINSVVAWDPDIANHQLRNSYYLDSIPDFFEDTIWPVFGPDITDNTKLPAQIRFENLPYLNAFPNRGSVGKYEKLEFTIENGISYDNPFDPNEVDISGHFISPSNDTTHINAFWTRTKWNLRFSGAEIGDWKYSISVNDSNGEEIKSGTFRVFESTGKGWIRPSEIDAHYLAYDDGTPFYGIGLAVPWLIDDSRYYSQTDLLSYLKSYDINMINWLFTSWDILLLRDSYAEYSMEDAEKFDALIADAEREGISILLGVWIHDLLRDAPHTWSGFYDWKSNPFNQLTTATGFFSDSLSWEYQKNYYRYIIARWGYSPAIASWHTVAEINGTNAVFDDYAMQNDESGWHNKINSYFIENDPFHHPTSVSGSGGYDFSAGWDVTQIPQVHEYPYPAENIKENPERIAYWSDKLFTSYEKPILVGEFGKSAYEEGISESFLHNGIWAGLMNGAAATPFHWWGGQIAEQPNNFSTFNETMLKQLQYLKYFVDEINLAADSLTPLYSATAEKQITLSNMPDGKAYGLSGEDTSICWIYQVDEYSTGSFSDVGLSFPVQKEGEYSISFYNTWEGIWYDGDSTMNSTHGKLELICPEFTGDLAMIIAYTGPITEPVDVETDFSYYRIYPNPSTSIVTIENNGNIESIQVIDIYGRSVNAEFPIYSELIELNLLDYERGIFFLNIIDHSGHSSCYKLILE